MQITSLALWHVWINFNDNSVLKLDKKKWNYKSTRKIFTIVAVLKKKTESNEVIPS